MTDMPSLSTGDLELLADSVRKTLEHLRDANERLGGNDAQIIEGVSGIRLFSKSCRPYPPIPLRGRVEMMFSVER
jgi:hypothetical protein